MTESCGTSSSWVCISWWTLAKGFLSLRHIAGPSCTAFTQGSQSTKNVQPGKACMAAWVRAQASVPGMQSTQSGGTPEADAMMLSSSSNTTKAQPFLASRGVGPSSLEPSEYTLPLKWPPGGGDVPFEGVVLGWWGDKVVDGRVEGPFEGKVAFGEPLRPLPHRDRGVSSSLAFQCRA
jgi:hypothetical protein